MIAITGACGFIGTNIAIEAIKRGHKVIALDNLSRNEVKNNLTYMEDTYKDSYEFIWADIRKRDDVAPVLFRGVDAIIHLAANPSVVKSIENPNRDFEINAMGTLNMLDIATALEVPFLYASTNKVYSDKINEWPINEGETRYTWTQNKNVDELYPVSGFGKHAHSMYGVSKLAGELYCQEYHLQHKLPMVIFRMSCIYGLFQKGVEEQAWIDWFLRQIMAESKITIYGSGKQVRDVLDGRDCARAYLDALEKIDKCDGEIFTLGGGIRNTYSLLEAIKIIKEIVNKNVSVSFAEKRPADQDIYISSLKRIRKVLGFKPRISFERSIKDMMKQYATQ